MHRQYLLSTSPFSSHSLGNQDRSDFIASTWAIITLSSSRSSFNKSSSMSSTVDNHLDASTAGSRPRRGTYDFILFQATGCFRTDPSSSCTTYAPLGRLATTAYGPRHFKAPLPLIRLSSAS